ncbi:hypothetical protein BO71DRAFT_422277 [Aspergillus ellipticus CBS 707.79]|uniref:Uncharacterized protein n=1 Tax=Aspergillus ellipticus CBS 707.79 TaxID=1448320 RepID=A0A319DQT5_9EURO|nr:hypothetical protein BO71DRAFT_422277 [Aspergillus ellipticus CBS 707.79]
MVSKPRISPAELRIPTAPTFPLSSPITEEVPSPASSSPEDHELERNRPFAFLNKAARKNPFIRKATLDTHGQEQQIASEARASYLEEPNHLSASELRLYTGKTSDRPTGLNLVTDFSQPTTQGPGDASPPTFVDLNYLKALSKVREEERTTQDIRGILKKEPSLEFDKIPDTYSKPERKRLSWFYSRGKKKSKDELSPSDRPIMIGLSMPFEESSGSNERRLQVNTGHAQRAALTPSIIVTPAKEDTFWTGLESVHPRPRATSSIYSQPTPYPVPAIPHFPYLSEGESANVEFAQRQSRSSMKRLHGPRRTSRVRSYSGDTAIRRRNIPDRLSINTETNRHQSEGCRSSAFMGNTTPTTPTRPPPLSVWWEKEVSCFSPETPEATVPHHHKGAIDSPDTPLNPFDEKHLYNQEQPVETAERDQFSFMFPGEPIQGSAAEYYQACAHELFSGRPYFECINHVCSMTPKDKIPGYNNKDSLFSNSQDRGILIDMDDKPQNGNQSSKDVLVMTTDPTPLYEPSIMDKRSEVFLDDPKENDASERGNIDGYARTEHVPSEHTPTQRPLSEYPQSEHPPSEYPPREHPPSEHPPHEQTREIPQEPAPPQGAADGLAPPEDNQSALPQQPGTTAQDHEAQPQPPDPTSPGLQRATDLQRATERGGSIPLSDMHTSPAPAYTSHHSSSTLPPRMEPFPPTREELTYSTLERQRIEIERRKSEKKEKKDGKKRAYCCCCGIIKKCCSGRSKKEGKVKRRWYLAICTSFLIIIAIIILLVMLLTRKGDSTPVQSQWLNLTGYPPMPTGIATIAGPEPQAQVSGCIVPSTLWSCALPPEDQSANEPYAADEPNFRVEIVFHNGTYPNSTTVATKSSKKLSSRTSDSSVSSSPSPPSLKDQTFLGNTTDNNTVPYAGEETPFYMTILSASHLTSTPTRRLARRSDSTFPNLETIIPSPAENSDGTAAAATLYPLPSSQPVRLYNRGLDTEHYGFYTYYDRSIFLSSLAPLNGSGTDYDPNDQNGGSNESDAKVRCTWSQTRFLVQIWTRSNDALLKSNSTTSTSTATATATTSAATSTSSSSSSSSSSSATDWTRPGSFPYPVTITLDRHGGTAKEKMVYCYAMESGERINATEKKLQVEDRSYGGTLINPAPGIFDLYSNSSTSSDVDGTWGGIDGGTGGCSCKWANWT